MELPNRIKRRITKDYTREDRQAVEELLLELRGDLEKRRRFETERIIAATLIHAAGKTSRLLDCIDLAGIDVRDILMGSGLEYSDWPDRLDAEFGT